MDFRDLIGRFNISSNTLFLYFKLRAVLKAHKVPWGVNLHTHPVVNWILNAPSTGIVSYFYLCFQNLNTDNFSKDRAWIVDLKVPNRTIEWNTVWDNTFHASTNPNHQFIHFKVIHRAYLTTRIRHVMGLSPHPYCNFCGPGCVDTLVHMLWDCPDVQKFWDRVLDVLYKASRICIPKDPVILLLNDNSQFPLCEKVRKFWLAAMTAAKKSLVQRWKPPHDLSIKHWLHSLLEILYLELSSARTNHANPRTVSMWENWISTVKTFVDN